MEWSPLYQHQVSMPNIVNGQKPYSSRNGMYRSLNTSPSSREANMKRRCSASESSMGRW